MIEEKSYRVRVTLTTTMEFSPIERETPITKQDAIANAKGTMPDDWFLAAEDEGWNVKFEAEEVR